VRETITDRSLLRRSLIVLGLTLVAFVLHGALHLEPATVAPTGAVALMLWIREEAEAALREVEWSTLFFVGLFMLVSGVIEVGLIDLLAEGALAVTGGALGPTAMLILWLSAILSAVVDNIPYTATMLPLVEQLTGGPEGEFLWWTLAMGADFGGNMTIIGASANVILAGLAAREGHPIGFWWFFKYGAIVTLGTMLICTVYVWLRYLV
jgi:Na+/H+ antiporter NhaD/arsenite permease-like protein